MAISDKIISFWKQVKLKSSDMFTLFKVGIGLKFPTHKLHVKDTTDPLKIEGLQNDTTDPDKYLSIDSNNIVKYRTGAQLASDIEVSIDDLHGAGVDGAANQLLTDDGDGTVTSESTLTYTDGTLTIDSSVNGDPEIRLKSSFDNAIGPRFTFEKVRTGADDTALGYLYFIGQDASDNVQTYAIIKTDIQEADHGSEGGELIISVATHDGGLSTGLRIVDGDANAELDVTLAAGTASVTTIAGTLTMGSTATIDNSGAWVGSVIPSAKLDSDTAHLSTTQTFTGEKTFERKVILDGNKSVTAGGDGVTLHVDAQDITDSSTSASGTAATFSHVMIENPRLMATNSSVTTTNAYTVFIKGAPVASTNQTITNAYSLYVAGGDAYFGANIIAGNNRIKDDDGTTCITFDSSGNTTIAGTTSGTFSGNLTGNASGTAATVTAAAQPNITSLHSSIAITKQVKVTLSTADCNALHTTPIELVAAQGANTVIVPTGGMIRVDRALTQGQSSADVNFHYEDKEPGAITQTSLAHFRRFMYNESGDRVFHIIPAMPYSEVSQNLTDDVNKALEVSVDSAFTNNCFTSIDIYLTYNVFDIS